MLGAILTLLGFELIGELVRSALHLPIPGPVVGMILLAVVLAVQARKKPPSELPEVTPLDTTAGVLLRHMGLLFIPAGVGIVAEADLLREEWLPIVGGLLGSTILSLAVTGFVMHRLSSVKLQVNPLPPIHAEKRIVP
jgi:holin-like protein